MIITVDDTVIDTTAQNKLKKKKNNRKNTSKNVADTENLNGTDEFSITYHESARGSKNGNIKNEKENRNGNILASERTNRRKKEEGNRREITNKNNSDNGVTKNNCLCPWR